MDLYETLFPGFSSSTKPCKNAVMFLIEIGNLLIEKNKNYGDAAARPKRIFSKASPVEQILVRIDDKLSRIDNLGALNNEGEDTIKDLVGYLALLRGVIGTNDDT